MCAHADPVALAGLLQWFGRIGAHMPCQRMRDGPLQSTESLPKASNLRPVSDITPVPDRDYDPSCRAVAMAPPDGHGLWADEVEAEDEARGVTPPKTFDKPLEWRGHSQSSRGAERSGWQPAYEGDDGREGFKSEEGGYTVEGTWHEGMAVERGASRQRLDMRHGFLRHIVSQCSCRFTLLCSTNRPTCCLVSCGYLHGCTKHATVCCLGEQQQRPAARLHSKHIAVVCRSTTNGCGMSTSRSGRRRMIRALTTSGGGARASRSLMTEWGGSVGRMTHCACFAS